jgi:alkyl hydroperoxide reductase subunit AhpC
MACLIPPGTKMRDFSGNLVKGDGQSTALWTSDNMDGDYILLCFFPMINAVDSTEINAIKANSDKFSELNCKVIGVTDEGIPSVKSWINMSPSAGGFGGPVGFDIICDKGMAVANQFGAKTSSGEPARAMYILDKNRIIRHCSFYPRYVGRSMESLVNIVTALNKIDSDDVIIPSGWKPGDRTIQNSPDGIYKYYGIAGSSITSGSLIQSEQAKTTVTYSKSDIEGLVPTPPSSKYAMSTDSTKSSKKKTSTTKTSSLPPSTVKPESSKSSTKPSTDKSSKELLESGPRSESSSETVSARGIATGTSGIPTPRSSKASTTNSALAEVSRSQSPSSKAPTATSKTSSSRSKTPTASTKPPSTTADDTTKSFVTSIDGRKMRCVCKVSDERIQTKKKLDCDCTQIVREPKSTKSVGQNSSNGNKYRVE